MINLLNWLPALVRQFTFYCSDSPDPPDPDPLIGQSALMQSEIGLEALDFYKRQYEENKPRQARLDDAVIKAVQSQQAIAEKSAAQGDEYYQYLKDTYRPLEQSIVQDAVNYNVPAEQERRAQAAGATVEQQIAQQRAAGERTQRSMGVRPDSGAAIEGGNWQDIVGAAMKAGAINTERTNVENYGRALKMDAAGLGRGLPGSSSTAYGISVGSSNSSVNNAGAAAQGANANAAMVGQGFNTALSGWGGAGNTALGQYGAQMNQYGAQLQQQGDMWGAVGTVAGAFMGSKFGSNIADRMFKADGGPLEGPGTGTSDSISAINVDSGEPVQVSNGEYVIPADVVRAKGQEFFDKLLEKYHKPAGQPTNDGMAEGGPVRGTPAWAMSDYNPRNRNQLYARRVIPYSDMQMLQSKYPRVYERMTSRWGYTQQPAYTPPPPSAIPTPAPVRQGNATGAIVIQPGAIQGNGTGRVVVQPRGSSGPGVR